jgi:hypothetical protein
MRSVPPAGNAELPHQESLPPARWVVRPCTELHAVLEPKHPCVTHGGHFRPSVRLLSRSREGAMAGSRTVNGRTHGVDVALDTPLRYVLRDALGRKAATFGCGLAQGGASTIAVEGAMGRSGISPRATVVGRESLTVEGLGTPGHPPPLPTAFLAEQAAHGPTVR